MRTAKLLPEIEYQMNIYGDKVSDRLKAKIQLAM
jgi:hypothetical protein